MIRAITSVPTILATNQNRHKTAMLPNCSDQTSRLYRADRIISNTIESEAMQVIAVLQRWYRWYFKRGRFHLLSCCRPSSTFRPNNLDRTRTVNSTLEREPAAFGIRKQNSNGHCLVRGLWWLPAFDWAHRPSWPSRRATRQIKKKNSFSFPCSSPPWWKHGGSSSVPEQQFNIDSLLPSAAADDSFLSVYHYYLVKRNRYHTHTQTHARVWRNQNRSPSPP